MSVLDGLEIPIVLAPMAGGAGTPRLAVSDAGEVTARWVSSPARPR